MGFLDNAISGAVGYAISEASKSHALRDLIDQKLEKGKRKNVTLRSLIEDYANEQGIYTTSNEFAHELHRIAGSYEAYNYEDEYGDQRY